MEHDVELLRRYADTGSHDAFASIVRRHVDVVYTAARRQSGGDAELAEEVTQRVFVLLATKARSLGDEVLLGGWLYNAVRFVTRDLQRSEQRRAKHEQKAAAARMQRDVINESSSQSNLNEGRASAEAVLDDAMADLDEHARGLLVLRFFQGKTAREVGSMLGISEEAARKRVSRAVEELRNVFARRGVVISAVGLTESLAAITVLQAPAHVAAAATAAAAVTGASAAAVATTASVSASALKGWAAIMAMSKAQTAVATIVSILVAGGGIVFVGAKAVQMLKTSSNTTSTTATPATPITGPTVSGTVRGPDGQPVAGAEVTVGTSRQHANPYAMERRRRRGEVVPRSTDVSGRFTVSKPDDSYAVMIRSPIGYAEVSGARLESGTTDVALKPWGRIEGVARLGNEPLAGATIRLWRVGDNDEPVHHEMEVHADAQGRFSFPQVAPGEVNIYRQLPNRRPARWRYVQIAPGETVNVQIGGSDRSIVGRVDVPAEMQPFINWATEGKYTYDATIRLDVPPADKPKHRPGEPIEEYWEKELAFGKTDDGKLSKEWQFGCGFEIDPDGSFRVDDLPSGKYTVNVRCFETDEEVRHSEDIAKVEMKFEIPADVGAAASEPIGIGTAAPTLIPRLRPGDIGPDFTVTTMDGRKRTRADHQGKAFVLVLWGTYGRRDEEMKGFSEFARRWGKDDRVAILGSFSAPNLDEAKKYIAEYQLDFPHTADVSLMSLYDCSWPSAVVVSADGKVLQKHLRGETLEKYVELAVAGVATTQPTPR